MFVALTKNNERVYINNAVKEEEYYCPVCNEKLSLKLGIQKIHHFSHKPNSMCQDNWKYTDMSEWHKNWQEKFPEESREIVFERKHRADVFINNRIIEFQHSKLPSNAFEDRNEFYTKLGYKVIWIFDASNILD